jgi:hypothetical protein
LGPSAENTYNHGFDNNSYGARSIVENRMQRESLTAKIHLFVVILSVKTIFFNFIISFT